MRLTHIRRLGIVLAGLLALSVVVALSGASSAAALSFYPVGEWPLVSRLSDPYDVAFVGDEVYVVDTLGKRIVVYSTDGTFQRTFNGSDALGQTLQRPVAIAAEATGTRLYVADYAANRISVFDRSGTSLGSFGSFGQGNYGFYNPSDVALAPGGSRLYVADTWNDRIQVYSTNGASSTFVRTIGNSSTIWSPMGVSASATEVYVADLNNKRVRVFGASSGSALRDWGITDSGQISTSRYLALSGIEFPSAGGPLVLDKARSIIERCDIWGNVATTTPPGLLSAPEGMTEAQDGYFYIADTGHDRIVRSLIGSPAADSTLVPTAADLARNTPSSVAVDSDGSYFVLESDSGRVRKYDSEGGLLFSFDESPTLVSPRGIATTGSVDEVYVCDTGNRRVVAYDKAGHYLRTVAGPGMASEFDTPTAIAVGTDASLYVVDSGSNRVSHVASDGAFIEALGTGQLSAPSGVAVGASGLNGWETETVWVADHDNYRVAVFSGTTMVRSEYVPFRPYDIALSPSGSMLLLDRTSALAPRVYWHKSGEVNGSFGSRGAGRGQLSEPEGIGCAPDGTVVIADSGNQRVVRAAWDDLPPITTISGDVTGPVSHNATVTLEATDTLAGVSAIYYQRDSEEPQPYVGPISITAEGETDITYWSVDRVDNVETSRTVTVVVDRLPPSGFTVFGDSEPILKAGPLFVSSFISGASEMRFGYSQTIADEPWRPFSVSSAMTLTVEGPSTLVAQYRDLAGNEYQRTFGCIVDGHGPVSTASRVTLTNVADGVNGITLPRDDHDQVIPISTGSVAVHLAATDALSRVSSIRYRVNGGTERVYTGPFSVTSEGLYTIEVRAVDIVGNTGDSATLVFGISKLPLGATINIGNNGYVNEQISRWTATVRSATQVRWRAWAEFGGWQPYASNVELWAVFPEEDGVHPLRAEFKDGIGTLLSVERLVTLDRVKPTVEVTRSPESWLSTGPAIVTVQGTDAASPIANLHYQVNDGALTTYTAPFPVSMDGSHTVQVWATDAAGNISDPATATFGISRLTLGGRLVVADDASAVQSLSVDVTATIESATQMRWRVDSAPDAPWTQEFEPFARSWRVSLGTLGVHPIQAQFIDRFGQSVTLTATILAFDETGPETTILRSSTGDVPDGVSGITLPRTPQGIVIPVSTTTATVELAAFDPLSDVASVHYRVDGGKQLPYTAALTFSDSGTHTVTAWSIDELGNVGDPVTLVFGISRMPSGGELTVGDGTGYTNTAENTCTASVVDATSVRWDTSLGFTEWQPFDAVNGFSALFPAVEGDAQVRVQFRDAIGTVREIIGETVLDFSGPQTSIGSIPAVSPTTASYVVSLSSTDTLSPVQKIAYTINGGEESVYTTPFPIAGDGAYVIEAWAIDAAGNTGDEATLTLGISRLPLGAEIRPLDPSPELEARGVDMVADVLSASEMRWRIVGDAWPVQYVPYSASFVATVPGVGTHTIEAEFKDIFGQTITATSSVTIVDHTGPVTSVDPTSAIPVADGVNGVTLPRDGSGNPIPVHTGATTVHINAHDLLSDVSSVHYRLDGSAEQTFTGAFTVSAEGTHTVEAWSVDALGNTGGHVTHLFGISPLPWDPRIVLESGTPFTRVPDVNWNTDVRAAMLMRWKTSGSFNVWEPYAETTRTSTFPAAEGLNQLVVQFKDAIGTVVEVSQLVVVDLTGPTTQVIHTDSPSTGPMTVALAATDNYPAPLAPAPVIKYTLDGGAETTYTTPFPVTDDGSHTVEAWSIDAAGNVGSVTTDSFGISKLPLGGALVAANGASVVITPTIEVSTTIQSAVSMRWRFVAPNSALPWTEEFQEFVPRWQAVIPADGAWVLEAQFKDSLGQTKTLSTPIGYDLTGPVTSVILTPDATATTGPTTVSIVATDALSPVRSIVYRINGGAQRAYTSPFTLSTEGTYTIQAWAFDATGETGNQGETTSTSFTLTRMMGAASVSIAGGAARIGVADVPVAVSALGAVQMCWDAGAGFGSWTTYKSSFTAHFASQGADRLLRVRVKDRFGVTRELTDTITIDLTAPVTTASFPFGKVINGPGIIVLSVSDLSGLKYTEYSLDGAAWAKYTMPILVTKPGVHSLRYRSMDEFGSLEAIQTEVFEVKTDAGTITFPGGRVFVNTTTVEATLAPMAATSMRIDVDGSTGLVEPFASKVNIVLPGQGLHWVVGAFSGAETTATTLTVPVFVDLDAPVISTLAPSLKSFRVYSTGNRYTAGLSSKASDAGQNASGIGSWAWSAGSYRAATAASASIYGPKAGTHAVSVVVTDRAGNSSSMAGTLRLGAARAPYVPRTATRYRYFTVKGTVPVAGPSATHRILCYKRASNGAWNLSKSIWAKPRLTSTTATFSNRIYLSSGSWRIVLSSARGSVFMAGTPSASIAVK